MVSRIVSFTRNLSENLSFSEVLERIAEMTRRLYSSFTFTDTNWYKHVSGAGESFVRNVYDAFTSSVSASRAVTVIRSLLESISFSEILTKISYATRNAHDAITQSIHTSKIVGFVRSMSESLSPSDLITRTVSFTRSLSESIAYAVANSRIASFLRYLLDSLTYKPTSFGTWLYNVSASPSVSTNAAGQMITITASWASTQTGTDLSNGRCELFTLGTLRTMSYDNAAGTFFSVVSVEGVAQDTYPYYIRCNSTTVFEVTYSGLNFTVTDAGSSGGSSPAATTTTTTMPVFPTKPYTIVDLIDGIIDAIDKLDLDIALHALDESVGPAADKIIMLIPENELTDRLQTRTGLVVFVATFCVAFIIAREQLKNTKKIEKRYRDSKALAVLIAFLAASLIVLVLPIHAV